MSKAAPDKLLSPISKDQPCGVSLRYDPVYDRIQEARREDDPNVPQGVWTTKLKKADWPAALSEIEAALAKRSKDLQLAIWRVEALLQIEGLPGLARGLRTVAALCRRYWPTLHPQMEDDDIDVRLAPLYWLDEKLPLRFGQLPIATVDWAEGKHKPTWFDLQSAMRIQPLANSKPDDFRRMVEHGAATQAMVEAAMRASPTVFYREMRDDILDALAAVEELRVTLEKCCGDDAPQLRGLREQLDKLATLVAQSLVERGVSLDEVVPEALPPATRQDAAPEEDSPVEPTAATGLEAAGEGPETGDAPQPEVDADRPHPMAAARRGVPDDLAISSREDAYRLLGLVADYLSEAEPHSPTPHLIRRAIAWGRMPFSELLNELIDEPDSRRAVHRLLNLPSDE